MSIFKNPKMMTCCYIGIVTRLVNIVNLRMFHVLYNHYLKRFLVMNSITCFKNFVFRVKIVRSFGEVSLVVGLSYRERHRGWVEVNTSVPVCDLDHMFVRKEVQVSDVCEYEQVWVANVLCTLKLQSSQLDWARVKNRVLPWRRLVTGQNRCVVMKLIVHILVFFIGKSVWL